MVANLAIASAAPAYTPTSDSSSIDTPVLCKYIYDHLGQDAQKFFVDSFLVTLTDKTVKFPVSWKDAQAWLGYGRKDTFKTFYTTNLEKGVDYEVFQCAPENPLGGRPSEDVSFTVDAFKRLGMLAKTERGMQVREYYLRLEKLVFQYSTRQLQDQLEETKRAKAVAVHNALIQGHTNRGVVYMTRMKQVDTERYIVKIGWSDDVEERDASLRRDFGDHTFIHIVDVMRPKQLEKHLKKHRWIKLFKDSNHYASTETYLVTDEIVEEIKGIIARDLPTFDTLGRDKELRLRKLVVAEKDAAIAQARLALDEKRMDALLAALEDAQSKYDTVNTMFLADTRDNNILDAWKLAQKHVNAALAAVSGMTSNGEVMQQGSTGTAAMPLRPAVPESKRRSAYYVQQYDPTSFKLLAVHEGSNEAINQLGEGATQPLRKAARDKTVYCGHRWALVSKDSGDDPNLPQDIGATVGTKQCHGGYVARLSEDLRSVMEVYASQKQAAAKTGRSDAAVCAMINKTKPGRESSRWLRWSSVDPDLKKEYLSRKALPLLPSRNGRAVAQLDPCTKELIDVHPTAAVVIRLFGMGSQTLNDACNGVHVAPIKSYLWRWAKDVGATKGDSDTDDDESDDDAHADEVSSEDDVGESDIDDREDTDAEE